MSNTSDVIIVGGGVIGNAAAYYLSKKGVSVTVLEGSADIGHGGSSRNGGGVRQSGRDPRELPLAMYGIQNLWPGLSGELGIDTEYTPKGNLRLGKTQAHLDILRKLTDRAIACGLDVRMIGYEEIKSINPYLSDEVIGASWCPTDGHANPLTATLGFYVNARRLGARFISGEKAVKLQKVKGRLRKVVAESGVYEAETVIVAAGLESRPLLNTVGIDVPMTGNLMECLVTEAQPYLFDQMLGAAEADFYGHQSKHGSFVFGGSSGFEGCTLDKSGLLENYEKTAPATCRGIMRYFPDLKRAKIIRTWAGFIDVCADGVPVLGNAEEVPGLVIACAFSGHGFGISPAVGYNLAELITTGKTPVDISALRYDRFKAKI
ncbi:MAG: FAD-binding oxidoreductase [Clostridiales bacterium]|nr:FAD-binding oxidoreductase [Clostridiales bacterium]